MENNFCAINLSSILNYFLKIQSMNMFSLEISSNLHLHFFKYNGKLKTKKYELIVIMKIVCVKLYKSSR